MDLLWCIQELIPKIMDERTSEMRPLPPLPSPLLIFWGRGISDFMGRMKLITCLLFALYPGPHVQNIENGLVTLGNISIRASQQSSSWIDIFIHYQLLCPN